MSSVQSLKEIYCAVYCANMGASMHRIVRMGISPLKSPRKMVPLLLIACVGWSSSGSSECAVPCENLMLD